MRPNLSWLLWLACLMAWAAPAHADERILDYHAEIHVAVDGSMTVTERIRVRAEGHRIRRGIYRDYPTEYRDRQHNRYRVGFQVLAVMRDGHAEPWHTKKQSNGVRVYIGDRHRTLASGVHTYTLRYRTTRQLGFFDTHDELYWNVTGTGWAFPIDHASATVHLPAEVDAARLKAYGYTGAQGATGKALDARILADGAEFSTTQPLAPHHGLTIVLEFPKGLVRAPDAKQKLIWLLHDNRNLLLTLLGLLVLWLYYGWAWNRFGRDPASGPLVARYEPPDGDSAAALRYVRDMGYDNTCFTAGILGLAARGCLDIEQHGKTYTLTRTADAPVQSLRGDSKALFQALFSGGDTLKLKQSERTRVVKARKAHEGALSRAYEKKYFFTNRNKLWPGVLISLLTLLAMVYGGGVPAAFMLLWLSIWSFGVYALAAAALRKARSGHAASSIGSWLFLLPFAAGEVAGLALFGSLVGYAVLPLFAVLIGTNIAFYHWMKAPTQDGARLLDGIEGFRWYLGVAEKQELDSRYKPESHPELFARYLPYAVALDVGNAWGERFAGALDAEQMRQAQPTWYHGSNIGLFTAGNLAAFGSSLGSGVNSAIASASVAPGSSSGSSGFSGGGGGGGGGGGW
ncbi:DUF2207 domain-containing protein [Oleiagrimonas citrea]|uniref:DUF2207 domain-containing protein n=1 Tax=Oleiagrimonas citrea TaxID=1665687 RepID=A0A846ZR23_9GAMM|nr:DUF2207 domain-containing protein [Oleiagrimonas citrea]